MQSFASPTHTNPPPHKNHALQIKHHKFMPHPHKKGATIAYTYALSTQKSIERAQLSPMPQERSLLNPLNRCEPQKHPQKWNPCGPKMPTNLREISHPQKQNL